MANDRASAFAEALQQFEQDRDLDRFAGVFAADAEVLRPEQRPDAGDARGSDGVRGFWQQYLDQFGRIRSEFSRVAESGPLGELEWTSRGSLGSGRDVEYSGVSLLEFDASGKVRRFATYYDTAALADPLKESA